MSDFAARWTETYGNAPPLAHALRAARVHGWFRVHALPDSKRYAGRDEEAAEVLRRVSAVGDAVLGPTARCELILVEAEGEMNAAAYRAVREAFGLTPVWRFDDPEGGGFAWTVHRGDVRWSGEAFAPLLQRIAVDEIADVLWLAESGSVFAPYDGGVDVFMRPPALAEPLRARFTDWLSPRPDGL